MSTAKPHRAVLAEPQPNAEARRARVYEPGWRYVPAGATDVSKTFARVRKQMKEAATQPPANVKTIHPELARPVRLSKKGT
jgi:hypothetical protein